MKKQSLVLLLTMIAGLAASCNQDAPPARKAKEFGAIYQEESREAQTEQQTTRKHQGMSLSQD